MPVCSPTFKKNVQFVFRCVFFFFNPPLLTSAADPSPVWETVQVTDGSHRRDPSLLEFSVNPLCTNKSVRNQWAVWSVVHIVLFFCFFNYDPELSRVWPVSVFTCARGVKHAYYALPVLLTNHNYTLSSADGRGEGWGSRNVKRAGENC